MDEQFRVQSHYRPGGDQPKAIAALCKGYKTSPQQTLLGVTGSGKTFTMAKVIEKLQRPALILSHNKTLAAQLYSELQGFFPDNKVSYFVSYYDYYQPESYMPASDTYIEKDTQINEKIERLRLEAASNLLARNDVIVVASVSAIYGFGEPESFEGEALYLQKKSLNKEVLKTLGPQGLARALVSMQYERNDTEIRSGRFRMRGDTVDVVQGSGTAVIRISFFGDVVEHIYNLHPISGQIMERLDEVTIYPAKPFIVPKDRMKKAIKDIREELQERLKDLGTVEAYRLKQRTLYDLEMIEQLGFCKGVENYSRHFDQRKPGSHPFTLIDFFNYRFKKDWLMFIDESHVTIPQIGGMYEGDRSRKKNLVDYGFRLPSALDNRPLKFHEFEKNLHHVVYVSATPGEYEKTHSKKVVEQIIRPTGLADPEIFIRPIEGQIDDLTKEIRQAVKKGYRVLVTTLTKRMSEDLSEYLKGEGIKTEYLHSEIDTLERNDILKNLRIGKFDVLVGINLLREGLDLPEVALVAILDADKEGFLRNEKSLIQTIGRAARNVDAKVLMYADKETKSIKAAVKETNRRRKIQISYNKKHGITPQSIVKSIAKEEVVVEPQEKGEELAVDSMIIDLEGQMRAAAEDLNFEKAIELREKVESLKQRLNR